MHTVECGVGMIRDVFGPTDILIPEASALERWSVIACDQFSSGRDYWERVRERVGEAPSALNTIIPEVYLSEIDEEKEIRKISSVMDSYIKSGVLREIESSFIYVERTQSDGRVRRGLVGAVDLEEYEFSGSGAAILASENTVLERLPARIRIRKAARFESPHIIAFIDDKEATVIEPLSEKAGNLPILYDFDLMEGGGHIRGRRVFGDDASEVLSALRELHGKNKTLMVVGDGNHSLAAAKVHWDELKQGLSEGDREFHPARRALIEVNNIYDSAISFEAIHRVVFDVDPVEFIDAFEQVMPGGNDYEVRWVSQGLSGVVRVSAGCIGDMQAAMQEFLDNQVNRTGCRVDYIHGADAVERLARKDRCTGLILPAMDKSELFETVAIRGVFPKKSFSVGQARDKRYYLECRVIM